MSLPGFKFRLRHLTSCVTLGQLADFCHLGFSSLSRDVTTEIAGLRWLLVAIDTKHFRVPAKVSTPRILTVIIAIVITKELEGEHL